VSEAKIDKGGMQLGQLGNGPLSLCANATAGLRRYDAESGWARKAPFGQSASGSI
jgi:hypothetical protein